MRRTILAVLLALTAVSLSPSPYTFAAAQAPQGQGGQQPDVRRRPPVELSETITHSPLVSCTNNAAPGTDPQPLRIATWNIRAGRSAGVEDIAAEIRSMRADVLALQEVDVLARRTGSVDQPLTLATALGFHYAFAASIKWDGGDYGLAVLSRWPLVDVQRHRIISPIAGEPRIVLEVTVCAGGRTLHLFNHHADVREESRRAGLTQLADLVRGSVGRGVFVLGDFNDRPGTPGVLGLLNAGLVDLGPELGPTTADGRLDYLLVDAPISRQADAAQIWTTMRSDHHAIVVDLRW